MLSEELLCCGSNFFGQLGIGYRTRSSSSFLPIQFCLNEMNQLDSNEIYDIQCGTQFTVIIKKNGEVS